MFRSGDPPPTRRGLLPRQRFLFLVATLERQREGSNLLTGNTFTPSGAVGARGRIVPPARSAYFCG